MDAIYVLNQKDASKNLQLWHDLIHHEQEAQLCRLWRSIYEVAFAMGIFGVSYIVSKKKSNGPLWPILTFLVFTLLSKKNWLNMVPSGKSFRTLTLSQTSVFRDWWVASCSVSNSGEISSPSSINQPNIWEVSFIKCQSFIKHGSQPWWTDPSSGKCPWHSTTIFLDLLVWCLKKSKTYSPFKHFSRQNPSKWINCGTSACRCQSGNLVTLIQAICSTSFQEEQNNPKAMSAERPCGVSVVFLFVASGNKMVAPPGLVVDFFLGRCWSFFVPTLSPKKAPKAGPKSTLNEWFFFETKLEKPTGGKQTANRN